MLVEARRQACNGTGRVEEFAEDGTYLIRAERSGIDPVTTEKVPTKAPDSVGFDRSLFSVALWGGGRA